MSGNASTKTRECLESSSAERYVLGELSDVERDQFEEHYFSCPECADSVRALTQIQDGVRAGLCTPAAETIAAQETGAGWLSRLQAWWLRPQLAYAGALAALCVATVTSYQNVQMREQLRPQAIHSVALQPATRGLPTEVPAAASGGFVLLETDLPGASGDLTWRVQERSGALVMEGIAPAPEPGLSFKLLLPGNRLQGSEYTVAVRSASGREWLFRFRTGQQ